MRYLQLILTGYPAFWPEHESNAIFLGPWCFANNPKHSFLEHRDLVVVDYLWSSQKDIVNASEQTDELLDRVMPALANDLNMLYGTNFSQRFWEISALPFLIQWLSILLDRYQHLTKVKNIIGDNQLLEVKIPLKTDQYHFDDNHHLSQIYITHEFNLCLLGQIIKAIRLPFLIVKEFDVSISRLKIEKESKKTEWKTSFISFLENFCNADIYWGAIHGLGFVDRIRLILSRRIKSKKALSPHLRTWIYPKINNDNITLSDFAPRNEYEEVVKKLLPLNLPRKLISGIPPLPLKNPIKYWISQPNDNQDELFALARTVEIGGKFIDVQHGGGYGQRNPFPLGRMEYATSSFFISYGWKHRHIYHADIKALPSPMLSRIASIKKNKTQNMIIFVSTLFSPYLLRFQEIPERLASWLENRKRFLTALDDSVRDRIKYKEYFNDYGLNERKYLSSIISPDQFISSKTNLIEYLPQTKLLIVDHCATVYLQGLVANIPTVVFWSSEDYPMVTEAEARMQLLEDCRIYHKTSESAANHINITINQIDDWWNSEPVQDAKRIFCQDYASTSDNYIKDWIDFAKSLD